MTTNPNVFIKWDRPYLENDITYVFSLDNYHIVNVTKYPRFNPVVKAERDIETLMNTLRSNPPTVSIRSLLWKEEKIDTSDNISSVKDLVELIVNKYLEIGWEYSITYKCNQVGLISDSIETYLIHFKKPL